MKPNDLQTHVHALTTQLGAPVVVYFSHNMIGKAIDEDDVAIFYQLLQSVGRTEKLYLVLNTPGGDLDSTRRIVYLLREYTSVLNVVVPFHAYSIGTLLALASNEITVTPIAALTPVDPILIKAGANHAAASSQPHNISSEDIRCFMSMAELWFDIKSESGRIRILEILCQKFFPSTISRFFRAERYTTQLMSEYLKHQLPTASDEERTTTACSLIQGYPSHGHSLTYRDLKRIGLNVRMTSMPEEKLLFALGSECNDLFEKPTLEKEDFYGVSCLLFSANFSAYHRYIQIGDGGEGEEATPLENRMSGWEIIGDQG